MKMREDVYEKRARAKAVRRRGGCWGNWGTGCMEARQGLFGPSFRQHSFWRPINCSSAYQDRAYKGTGQFRLRAGLGGVRASPGTRSRRWRLLIRQELSHAADRSYGERLDAVKAGMQVLQKVIGQSSSLRNNIPLHTLGRSRVRSIEC